MPPSSYPPFRNPPRFQNPCIVLLILSSLLVPAAAANLKLSVVAGAGGYVRQGTIAPVQVTFSNDDGPGVSGVVTVQFRRNNIVTTTAHRALDLATGATKRLTLYLPVPYLASTVNISYKNARGKELLGYKEDITLLPASRTIFAAIGNFPSSLPPNEEDGKKLYSRLYLQPDQIPDRHEGLEMFDVIIIAPPLSALLSRSQATALRDWVLRGGLLILDASLRTEAYRRGTLDLLMPFRPQNTISEYLDLFDEETYFATGHIESGKVLLDSNGHPLIVRGNCGLGSVVCFTIDMEQPALQNWEGAGDLWRAILGPLRLSASASEDAEFAALMGTYDPDHQSFLTHLTALVRQAPNTQFRLSMVLVLTLLYALVAGPGDYFFIRKLGRPILTWVTFPLIVAFFTLVAYFGAKSLVGGDTAVSFVRRLTIFQDRHVATQYELTSLFVAETDNYKLSTADGAMLRQLDASILMVDPLDIDEDQQVWTHRIPVWTHRVYSTGQTLTRYPDVSVRTFLEEGTLVAEVTNNSEMVLRHGFIAHKQRTWPTPLEEIQPGQTVSVTLGPAPGPINKLPQTPIFSGTLPEAQTSVAVAREFDYSDAFRRGALLFQAQGEKVTSSLFLNGERRPEKGEVTIQVLTYEVPTE